MALKFRVLATRLVTLVSQTAFMRVHIWNCVSSTLPFPNQAVVVTLSFLFRTRLAFGVFTT